jgi:6-pyruvoyl-tetrahydropterin synthase
MRIELLLNFNFEASHSLVGYEEPHPHLWNLEIAFTGTPIDGKIVDMVSLRVSLQNLIDPIIKTYLNENGHVDESVRAFPTCETLSQHFLTQSQNLIDQHYCSHNSSLRVSSVRIGICDLNGCEAGAVKISL